MKELMVLACFLFAVQAQALWTRDIIKADPAASQAGFGEGMKIAVIDSGIDTSNPAFKNIKIVGKDFFGDNDTAPYPYYDNEGHGTHVAGIIAGVGPDGSPIGLAPKATIFAARVCGAPGCGSENIVQGIEWAVSEGVDVINISIQGERTSPEEATAIGKAIAAGIPVITITGNDDGDGPAANADASVDGVIVVGAVNKWGGRPFFSQTGFETIAAPGVNILSAYPGKQGFIVSASAKLTSGQYTPDVVPVLNTPLPKSEITEEIAFAGHGVESDYAGVSASGKIVIVSQGGGNTIDEKIDEAEQRGAKALIVLLRRPYYGIGPQTFSDVSIPVLLAPADEESPLRELMRESGRLSLSATTGGNYELQSGTSMAAPFVTGAVALIKSVNRKLRPGAIKDILVRSATRSGEVPSSPLAPNPSGILNVQEALKLATDLSSQAAL